MPAQVKMRDIFACYRTECVVVRCFLNMFVATMLSEVYIGPVQNVGI